MCFSLKQKRERKKKCRNAQLSWRLQRMHSSRQTRNASDLYLGNCNAYPSILSRGGIFRRIFHWKIFVQLYRRIIEIFIPSRIPRLCYKYTLTWYPHSDNISAIRCCCWSKSHIRTNEVTDSRIREFDIVLFNLYIVIRARDNIYMP